MDINTLGSRILRSARKLGTDPQEAVSELTEELKEVEAFLSTGQKVKNPEEAQNIDSAIEILKDSQEKVAQVVASLSAVELMEPYIPKLENLSEFLKRGERVEKTGESEAS